MLPAGLWSVDGALLDEHADVAVNAAHAGQAVAEPYSRQPERDRTRNAIAKVLTRSTSRYSPLGRKRCDERRPRIE